MMARRCGAHAPDRRHAPSSSLSRAAALHLRVVALARWANSDGTQSTLAWQVQRQKLPFEERQPC